MNDWKVCRIDWQNHILLVFSVVAGLALAKLFEVFISFNFQLYESVICGLIFFVIFDNWYFLHKDLTMISVRTPLEVVFHLASLVVYACLPFLYGISLIAINQIRITENVALTDPADFLIISLMLICAFDAARKGVIVSKLVRRNEQLNAYEKQIVGAYIFFVITGIAYSITLFILLCWGASSDWTLMRKTLVAVPVWIVIRFTDNWAVPKIAGYLRDFFLKR